MSDLEGFQKWQDAHEQRVRHEWRQWFAGNQDMAVAHRIVNEQCNRIDEAAERFGVVMKEGIAHAK